MELSNDLQRSCTKSPGNLLVYRCTICGVIFETKNKILKHKADKHGHEITEPKINNTRKPRIEAKSAYEEEAIINLKQTTPDVVKIGSRNKRNMENRRCKFCQEIIKTPYNTQIIKGVVNQEFLACLTCYEKIIKQNGKSTNPKNR